MSSVAEKLQRKSQRAVATKQVRLKLVYVDFWSAIKLSFLVAVALGIVLLVVTFLVWMVLNSTGIFSDIDALLGDLTGQESNLVGSFSLLQVMGFAVILALLNVVVGTALGAVGALLYNAIVKLTGGLLLGFTNN
ncbi:MAG: hypothetical protein JWP30_228 [Homoserinimonas sp.]|jgi:hypothetical protein|nr:hypothetical protein [Homoserinimonas sp.]